jgi:hypothetical protein
MGKIVANPRYEEIKSQVNARRPVIEAIAAEIEPALLTEIQEGLDQYMNSLAALSFMARRIDDAVREDW